MPDGMMEIKELFSDTQKTVEALRSDVEGLKGKSADYVDNQKFDKMKADIAAGLEAEQKSMMERLEKVETAGNRPGAPGGPDEAKDAAYNASFVDYLRKGEEGPELKSMATNTAEGGGFMVSPTIRAGIQTRHRRTSPIRMLATVEQFSGASYDVLIDRDDLGYEWAGETGSRSETNTPTVNRISIVLHELSAMPKVSQRMLDVADFDIESWLVGKISDKFARAEATAFVSGNGVNMPKGFLAYDVATDADADRAAGKLQYRATGAAGDFAASAPADVLTRTFYDLQGVYQANASWLMKNTVAADVAVLKDGADQYLLQSMLNTDGQIVRTVQGRPMYVADDMPAKGAGSLSIAVGDFTGYTIADNTNVVILRDPFSAKPNVLFYATKRVGGGITDFDAIKVIKFATS
ncbi:phage major capsid protein [Maritimibacter alexandrii]|uniref:phage major capsid protein n=1 Tax=Maritimibacter alexandrii TaxID=2570355 RepID=UPI001107C606|nr:phage major capsid protein [Maritimibacter alexandrii]